MMRLYGSNLNGLWGKGTAYVIEMAQLIITVFYEYKKISNESGQGRYPEWDCFDAIIDLLVHKPSTQALVVDASTQQKGI